MPKVNDKYELLSQKITSLQTAYTSLHGKSPEYVFSALCVKAHLYKNPALILCEEDFEEIIVDGKNDGGVDILLTDPNSENSDLVIGQSKFYTSITTEDISNAMIKMALFYKDMVNGEYEHVNKKVQKRFLSLNSEQGEDATIHFVFYTSAAQAGIKKKTIEKRFRDVFTDSSRFEVSILFGADIAEEIRESESRRPSVESGKISIDRAGNLLEYGEEAIIVNASAFSIKALYAQHNINLLSKNLRYHIAGREIDQGISASIRESPETFWFKNNGITIVCDDFFVDGREVKLHNFSIINGGQTTYLLHKSNSINEQHDLFLPCRIIRTSGETEDEKHAFSLEIARATNTQKPIKAVDLKANTPEQVSFARTMREIGLFYQTKRGEEVPRAYREAYLNSSLLEIGKLCLAAIFQLPGTSRNKPSTIYNQRYYDIVFSRDQIQQKQIAMLCKELLYIDFYFRTRFLKRFDNDNAKMSDENIRIPFAHNARTVCIAFIAFATRYYQKNVTEQDLQSIFNSLRPGATAAFNPYEVFSNLSGVQYFISPAIFEQKDVYDEVLYQLFTKIINVGISSFSTTSRYESSLTATNYLKNDKRYFEILMDHWSVMRQDVLNVLSTATAR